MGHAGVTEGVLTTELQLGLPPILAPLFEPILGAKVDGGPPAAGAGWEGAVAAQATPTEYAWITTRVAMGGPLARIVSLVTLRRRLAGAQRELRRAGYLLSGHFGAYPVVDSPRFVFQLDIPSSSYTESHLIPGFRRSRIVAMAWAVLHSYLGFSPAIGGVLTVGVKR
jgi:hypothetical protein